MKDQTEPAAIDSTTIARRWRASFTRRWHANADLCDTDDPVSGHQCRVALLMLAFDPHVSREALIAALAHDQGEMRVGDMNGAFKAAHPDLMGFLDGAERRQRFAQGLEDFNLAGCERDLIEFCDRLDAFLWMLRHRPQIQTREDWQDADRELDRIAAKCGLPIDLIDDLASEFGE